MYARTNRTGRVNITKPTFSSDYVGLEHRRSRLNRMDMSEIGGKRLKTSSEEHLRLPGRLIIPISGMPRDFLENFIADPRIVNAREYPDAEFVTLMGAEATAHPAMVQIPLENKELYLEAGTGNDAIYFLQSDFIWEDPLTAPEIAALQVSLKPVDELTPEDIVAHADWVAHVAKVEAGKISSVASLVDILTGMALRDSTIYNLFGAAADDDTHVSALGQAIDANAINTMSPAVCEQIRMLMLKANASPIGMMAIDDVLFSLAVSTGLPPSVLVAMESPADVIVAIKSHNEVTQYVAPDFLHAVGQTSEHRFEVGLLTWNVSAAGLTSADSWDARQVKLFNVLDPDSKDNGLILSLGLFNSGQITSSNSAGYFGLARAISSLDGLYRDGDEVNRIAASVFFRFNPTVLASLQNAFIHMNQVEMGKYIKLISYLKSGHSSQADNLQNTASKLTESIDEGFEGSPINIEEFINLVVYYGFHPASIRLLLGKSILLAKNGDLTPAVTKRLFPDGPGLSSSYNINRIMLRIEATNYFSVTNNVDQLNNFKKSFAMVKKCGRRGASYASYMYGSSKVPSAFHIGVVESYSAYAAAFNRVMPDSTIGGSRAVIRAINNDASNDLLVATTVESFIKAYRAYIMQIVTGNLKTTKKLTGGAALTLEN
jgi:hypothetical protein